MPHQRTHSSSQANGHMRSKAPRPTSVAPIPPSQTPGPGMGMSPTSRYDHNLKVLRRRDPSITTIFDQFSHVCVYHFNIHTEKWEKLGYEGSMFLYERNEYPPYGFYVLNRAGMEDYIQRMYPDNDIGKVNGYFMTRSYPEYTAERLATLRQGYPEEAINPFSDIWQFPDPPPTKQFKEEHSTFKTIGLWVFAGETREPLTDVMIRLHSFVKKNERYPDEYRYGPDRPPPPNPNRPPTAPRTTITPAPSNVQKGSTPEFNTLLAKLNSSAAIQQTPSRMGMSVETLFATVGRTPQLQNAAATAASPPPHPRSQPTTGIPLLDSIFASASTSSLSPPSQPEPVIYSPKPSSSALPQILNQDVISTLLGLPPSRSASTASFSSSREADCEDLSESSTALDLEAEPDAAGASAGRPLISREFAHDALGLLPHAPENGDVTPRAPVVPVPPIRTATVQADLVPLNDNSNGRRLVPFDDSDTSLWPYPRAPLDEEEEELVELDFQDTSALSDTEKFRREEIKTKMRNVIDSESEASGLGIGRAAEGKKNRRGKGSKKKRNEKEREEIEKGWDFPASIVPPPPPVPASEPVAPLPQATTTVANAPTIAKALSQLNGKAKAKVNEHTSVPTPNNGPVDASAVMQSILGSLRPSRVHLERNDFVREVLTLIHTDKTFVDSLWQDYLARTNTDNQH